MHIMHFWPLEDISFFLELLVIALLFSSTVLDTSNLGAHLLVSHFLLFHTVHEVLAARILEWVAVSSCSGPCFVRILHYDLSFLGGPAWHDFIELCKPLHLHMKCTVKGTYQWTGI